MLDALHYHTTTAATGITGFSTRVKLQTTKRRPIEVRTTAVVVGSNYSCIITQL